MGVRQGYKNTEAGLVPTSWEARPLKDIASIRTGPFGTLLKADEYSSSDGVPMISVGEVGDGEFRVHDSTPLIPPTVVRRLPEYVLNEGDIVLGRKGAVDRSAVIKASQSGWFLGSDGIRIRLSRDCYAPFVGWQFQRGETKAWLLQNATGTTMPSMNQEILRRVVIALPPLVEQRAIAEALGDVDALLAGLDKLIAKKRDLKQAAMQQLLTGQTRLPGFKATWKVKRLADHVDVDPEQLGADTRADYEFRYVSLEDVDQGTLRGFSSQFFRTAPSRARRKLRFGDVLVSTVRPNLKSHLYFAESGADWVCSTGFAVIRCREGITHPWFIFAHLFGDVVSRQIDSLLSGSNYPAINSGDVRELRIPFPEFDEQSAIANVLSDMGTEITALEARRDKTRLIKQGMMQELLTGRTRLV